MLLLNLMLAGGTDLLAVLLQELQLTDEVSGDVAGSSNPVSGRWACAVYDPTIPSSWIFCPIALLQLCAVNPGPFSAFFNGADPVLEIPFLCQKVLNFFACNNSQRSPSGGAVLLALVPLQSKSRQEKARSAKGHPPVTTQPAAMMFNVNSWELGLAVLEGASWSKRRYCFFSCCTFLYHRADCGSSLQFQAEDNDNHQKDDAH